MTPKKNDAKKHGAVIRSHALGYPETHEDFPWGETAFKVKQKTFVFMRCDEDGLSMGVKLPQSGRAALKHSFCEPTHYGLGKSGWVTATFAPADDVPIDLLKQWVDESYRAVAPKTLVKQMDAGAAPARPAVKARKAAKK